jgi:hypothetical protein
MDLEKDIFKPVAERIRKRADSLKNIKKFPRTGIEGWFKVEIIAALDQRVFRLQNKGPDLLLDDDTEIEIKAATDFNKVYLFDPIRKYGCLCLFLGDGKNPELLTENVTEHFEFVAYEIISDGMNDWLLGLIKPKL